MGLASNALNAPVERWECEQVFSEAAGLCHSGVDVACTASDERIELMLTLQLRDEPPS